MEVDNDIDHELMARFSSLGTTDHDVLINELQRLLDFQLNQAGCVFFLDMNNWNLQAAIGSYYDFNGTHAEKLPSMEFVRDVTIGEGESIPPQTSFLKTWRLKNNGTDRWPAGIYLKFTYGDQLGAPTMVSLEPLAPMSTSDVSVQMISPSKHGIYQGQWRMCTTTGQYFGDIIWVIICVEQDGLLGVTQQLSELGHKSDDSLLRQDDSSLQSNPFAPHSTVSSVPFNSPIKQHNDSDDIQHSTSNRVNLFEDTTD